MKGVPEGKRDAVLRSVVCFSLPSGQAIQDSSKNPGVIKTVACKESSPGLPYRRLIFIPEIGKYYAQFTPEELKQHDHRKQTVMRMLPQMKKLLEEFYA